MNWKKTAIAAAIALGIVGVTAYAHPFAQPVHGYAGMMGGYGGYGMGPGMMGGYGGYGMGPGMMGGYGGYGMGPGMMGGYGGYGMGPGMMGGYGGYGAGAAMPGGPGFGAIERLDLSDAQRKQVLEIENTLRKKNWDLMGKLREDMWKLRADAGDSGKRDWDAIEAANKRATEIRQQMFANSIQATKQVEALLTPQQREQYRRLARAWNDDDADD